MVNKSIPGMENWFNPESFKPFMGTSNANFDDAMESHRRNMETLASAGQAAAEFTKTITQAHTKYLRESMEDMNQFWRDWLSTGTNWQDKAEIQNQVARDSMSKVMAYTQEMSKLLQKTQEQVTQTWGARAEQGMKEAQKMAKKTTEAATKTK